MRDPARLKWRKRITPGTPLPTPWPKAEFEEPLRESQRTRTQLRKANRPKSEMNALFHREQRIDEELFMSSDSRKVGSAAMPSKR